MDKDIRIAVIVCRCIVGDRRYNLDQIACWAKAAADEGAEIVAFPEMNISGYLTRDEIGRFSETIPGPSTGVLTELAINHHITILSGLAEANGNGNLFASHVVAWPDGRLDVYRKIHTAAPEKGLFTPGNDIPVFHISGMAFGIQLCYDAHFPELSVIMALKKADVIFIPHASPRGTPEAKCRSWMRHLPARAFDNGVYVIAWNQTGDNTRGLTFPGLALALDPLGRPIHERMGDGDDDFMTLIDLDAAAVHSVRNHRMCYFLPNRRPELYAKTHAGIENSIDFSI